MVGPFLNPQVDCTHPLNFEINMKILLGLLISISLTTTAFAQTFPTLAKNWQGTVSVTTYNKNKAKDPNLNIEQGKTSHTKGWSSMDAPATLSILRQEGRHLELLFKTGNYESIDIGTISEDGKQIQISFKTGAGIYNITENKITGCGFSRDTDGASNAGSDRYSSWCDSFTPIK